MRRALWVAIYEFTQCLLNIGVVWLLKKHVSKSFKDILKWLRHVLIWGRKWEPTLLAEVSF